LPRCAGSATVWKRYRRLGCAQRTPALPRNAGVASASPAYEPARRIE
jgi:hypothetical protein